MLLEGIIELSQYLPLTAFSPSVAFISQQESAGSSSMEPSATNKKKRINLLVLFEQQSSVQVPDYFIDD